MSYYSDNDWRYYSEDYLEHASLRDKWNDLMSKTTVDDKIKGAYEGAKNAVGNAINNAGRAAESFRRSDTAHRIHSNVTSATRPIRNAGRAIGAAASNAGSAVSGAASKASGAIRNMFGKKYEWPGGNNSEEYNHDYYERFKARILEAQKAYREAKKNLRRKVHQTDNKIDDAILRGYDRGKANLVKGGVSAANAVRGGVNKARTNVTNAYNSARDAASNAYDSARDNLSKGISSVRDNLSKGVNTLIDKTPMKWDDNLRDSYNRRRTVNAGNQRRNSNRG